MHKEIKPKDLSKALAKKFACSASYDKETGEIDIQGDVGVDLVYFLVESYNIPKKAIKLIDKTVKKKKEGEEEIEGAPTGPKKKK